MCKLHTWVGGCALVSRQLETILTHSSTQLKWFSLFLNKVIQIFRHKVAENIQFFQNAIICLVLYLTYTWVEAGCWTLAVCRVLLSFTLILISCTFAACCQMGAQTFVGYNRDRLALPAGTKPSPAWLVQLAQTACGEEWNNVFILFITSAFISLCVQTTA